MVRWILPFIALSSFALEFIPEANSTQKIRHKFYSIGYDENIEGSRWTYYVLNKKLSNGTTPRKNYFKADPKVYTGSAAPHDYKGSGFDRGHLVPAGDMKLSKTSMKESFFMSNISPQHPSFNRGKWRALENRIRKWFLKISDLHIFTGPIFYAQYNYLNGTHIAIPDAFYKIIYSHKYSQSISFIMENKKLRHDPFKYVVTIDDIEKLTKIDFLRELPDYTEKKIESQINVNYWEKI